MQVAHPTTQKWPRTFLVAEKNKTSGQKEDTALHWMILPMYKLRKLRQKCLD